jgi:RNA polymerase sigma-70 factor (ECF subfamily)
MEGPEAREPAPDLAAERAEIRERVEKQLGRLPEQRRTAFRLVDVDGMAAEEAGRIMGLSPGTVRAHVHHARRQLRDALAEYAAVTKDHGG